MIIDPYKPGTDLTASSLQWQVIQTNTNGLFFFLLFLVISGNKTDSAKILIIAVESSGEIGLHRPLAHDIPCHAIYRQCLGTMYKSTMEGYSCAFPNPDRLTACIALLLYGSRLCIMRRGYSGCAWDWDRPHGACQNPEHWSVYKMGFLEDQV